MSETMHVVCLKETGHVLAAIAVTTPGAAPDLAAVAGADLSISSMRSTADGTAALAPATTFIPAVLLELKSVPFDARVIANPMHHAVDGGRIAQLPPFAAPADLPAVALDTDTVTLNPGTLDTIGFAAVARTGDPSDQRRVQSGKFVDADGDGNADALVLPLHILPGDTPAGIEPGNDYDVFVALQGLRPYWAVNNVP